MVQELIPGLPDDIARQCLIRIPFHRFGPTRSVCKLWKQEIESPLFHRIRRLSDLTRPVIALSQAEPALSPFGPAHKYHAASTPSYRLAVFDLSTAAWQSLPAIPGLENGLPLFCQIAAAGRELVVVGGWDPETWAPSDGVYIYDFATATWREGARMPGPRRSFFACAAADSGAGRVVFVAGGHDEEKNALRSALAYDVAGDAWAPLPDMARERDECKGVFLRGRFHVIGGYATEHQGRFGKSAEAFEAATWRWGPAEEDALEAATCPRTGVAGPGGRMYMCRLGHVAVREGRAWRAMVEVPEDASVAPVLVTWQDRVVLMGSGSHGGAQQVYVLEEEEEEGEERRMTWQKVEVPADYSGHVQAACCVEI